MSKLLNITQAQRAAASPQQSVWVTANAGTGKTKVLTDRVLRLLLTGTVPEKILCLTYTRAAAAEMLTRLQKELAIWVRLSDSDLDQTLQNLTGHAPDDATRQRARRLFLQVLEAPEGVRIMTIHSLCQSLLKRFSLEAGVSPYFRLMEESQTSLLLREARHQLFTEPRLPKGIADLTPHLQKLAARLGEDELDGLLDEIIKKRGVFESWFRDAQGATTTHQQVKTFLGITDETHDSLLKDYYETLPRRLDELAAAVPILRMGGKGDNERADTFDTWLVHWRSSSSEAPDDSLLQQWFLAFLTATNSPRKSLLAVKQSKANPQVAEFLLEEQARIHTLAQALFTQEAADWSLAMLSLAEALLALYAKLKRDRGFLDYDDLINDTYQLLNREGIAPWILFKLDSGIDHLLVDEAQDTSPIQWQIIKLLAEEFFTGESSREDTRTLFVVGDEKQSIYRFQGADPEKFAQMKQHFAQKIISSGEKWQPVSLSLSFRSTPAVLKLVDTVLSNPTAAEGVLEEGHTSQHQASRQLPGRVELWPLAIQEKDAQARTPWQVPDSKNARENPTAESQCAETIASTLANWLQTERHLPARGRAVQAGDILILVRRRSPFYYRLIRALKKHQVPVAGEDRLKLLEQLAVQDMLALADFLLLPQDDLSLACVLKSPLFNVSEEALFTLANPRKSSLWDAVRTHRPDIASQLSEWLSAVDYLRPYELLARILEADSGREKLASRLGTQVHDPLDELLNLARDYERLQPPSLQGFVQELRREEITIKREMEQSGDEVRVMTVHGSKGLQAPIVILPDTVGKPSAMEKLLWTDDTALFAPDDAAQSHAILALKDHRKQAELREYRRLLYVAMTRAADELYVTGWLGANAKAPADDCWYAHIAQAMEQIGVEQPEGHWVLTDVIARSDSDVAIQKIPTSLDCPASLAMTNTLPAWVTQNMPDEPLPPRPLTPSRPKLAEPAADSPLIRKERSSAKRGTLIHHLLEILPDIAAEHRRTSAEILLKQHQVPEEQRHRWIEEVLDVLNDARFTAVFGQGSLAEVPITAMLAESQILSGQIDRLVVLKDSVLIVDYKTSRNVPQTQAAIPEQHRQQMQLYVDTIRRVYPDKRVEAAILWTHTPKLMPLAITPCAT
ncbi:MAG: double-strand break repair helicase AddA [Rickettsiales bacterium]|nr:double-strand break repair helicase AddA [Rickettsiales bacterium]